MFVCTGDDTGLVKVVTLRDKRVARRFVVGREGFQSPANSVSAMCWAGYRSGISDPFTKVDTTAEQEIGVATRCGRVQLVSLSSGRVVCQYQLDLSKSKTTVTAPKRSKTAIAAAGGSASGSAPAAPLKMEGGEAAPADAKETKETQMSLDHPIKGIGVLGRYRDVSAALGAGAADSGAAASRAFVTCLDTGKVQVLRFPAIVKPDVAPDGESDAEDADADVSGEADPKSHTVVSSASSSSSAAAATELVVPDAVDSALLAPTASDIIREFDAGPGVCRMRVYEGLGASNANGWFACGGKERALSFWDALGPSDKPIWTEKALPNDELNLRRPVWINDLAFMHHTEQVIATATCHNEVRLYDMRVNRRAVLDLTGDGKVPFAFPFTSVCFTPDDQYIIAGDSTGSLRKFDVRKGLFTFTPAGPSTSSASSASASVSSSSSSASRSSVIYKPTSKNAGLVCGAFRGVAGSVRAITCHPLLPLLGSVGFDRHVRVHHVIERTLTHKTYLRQKLNTLLFSAALPKRGETTSAPATEPAAAAVAAAADGDDVWAALDARGAAAGSADAEDLDADDDTFRAPANYTAAGAADFVPKSNSGGGTKTKLRVRAHAAPAPTQPAPRLPKPKAEAKAEARARAHPSAAPTPPAPPLPTAKAKVKAGPKRPSAADAPANAEGKRKPSAPLAPLAPNGKTLKKHKP